jgi:hypothetical protein
MSEEGTRDALFECVDTFLNDDETECHLQCMVHNAGQYVGITAENSANLPPSQNMQYGDGSLLTDDGRVNFKVARYYQQLYGECWVDLCERSLQRMKNTLRVEGSRGCLIGISSPGCNLLQGVNAGYAMPGTGKNDIGQSCKDIFLLQHSSNFKIVPPFFVQRKIVDGIFHADFCLERCQA